MRIFLFIIFLLSNILNAEITDFDTRQDVILKLKEMVLKEEQIATAYEEYILENYNIPADLNAITSSGYLGSYLDFITNSIDTNYFETPVLGNLLNSTLTTISYGLKSVLKTDAYFKNLYESNTFRKKTFYANNKINFIINDDYAKHLLYLISKQGVQILDCITIGTKYCKKNEHIYIYDDITRINLLMYYHKDKFKTGPIIITNDTSLQNTSDEFNFIPKGAILYDTDGIKYVKTLDSIEKLK